MMRSYLQVLKAVRGKHPAQQDMFHRQATLPGPAGVHQRPPGTGWTRIPDTKRGGHGGWHRRKGRGWEQWYPNGAKGPTTTAAADPGLRLVEPAPKPKAAPVTRQDVWQAIGAIGTTMKDAGSPDDPANVVRLASTGFNGGPADTMDSHHDLRNLKKELLRRLSSGVVLSQHTGGGRLHLTITTPAQAATSPKPAADQSATLSAELADAMYWLGSSSHPTQVGVDVEADLAEELEGLGFVTIHDDVRKDEPPVRLSTAGLQWIDNHGGLETTPGKKPEGKLFHDDSGHYFLKLPENDYLVASDRWGMRKDAPRGWARSANTEGLAEVKPVPPSTATRSSVMAAINATGTRMTVDKWSDDPENVLRLTTRDPTGMTSTNAPRDRSEAHRVAHAILDRLGPDAVTFEIEDATEGFRRNADGSWASDHVRSVRMKIRMPR